MKIAHLFVLSLLAPAVFLRAESVIQEDFSCGPGVPGREKITPGTRLKQSGAVAPDNAAWDTAGAVVFAPGGKGLTFVGKEGNAGVFIEVDPGLFESGSPVRAEIEFVPGEAWVEPSGLPGIWLGFANSNSAKKELLANVNETGDHVALRYAAAPDPVNWCLRAETGVSGETGAAAGAKVPMRPDATYRMTLVYDPSDHSFQGELSDPESGSVKSLKGKLSIPPVFNLLRVDFTGFSIAPGPIQPLIKSISLTKE